MKVRIIAGPARCGKTQRLLDAYRRQLGLVADRAARLAVVPKCCWIAPNHTAMTQLQDSLLCDSTTAVLNPGLFTFASFAQSVISSSPRRIRLISPLQKRRLLRHVIRTAQTQSKLQHFASVANTPGFVLQVDEMIADKKRADMWPEAFEQWCAQRPSSDRRNRELAHLYSAYQAELHRGELYDAEGRFWAAREILAATSQATGQQYELVVVSGFNDFTTAQLDILQQLGKRSESMLVSLTVEAATSVEDQPARSRLEFAKTNQTLTRLREVFPQLEIEYLTNEVPSDGSLSALQQQAFREPVTETTAAGEFSGVAIVAAASEMGEVEAIAQRIKSLLTTGTSAPEEVVVVHRGGEDAVRRIASVLRDYGIPLATEISPRLEAEPLVRTLVGLLRLVAEDWPFQSLLEIVGNRLFTRWDDDEQPVEFRQRRRVAIEYCLRTAQLPAGKAALLEQLDYRVQNAASSETAGGDRRTAQLALALDELRQLEQWLAGLPDQADLDTWIDAIERLLQQMGVFASPNGRSREANCWRQLRRGLRNIGQLDDWLDASSDATLADLQELVATVARDQRVAGTQDAVGRVRVLSAESARKLSIKHLFLAGLNEQAFSDSGAAESSEDETLPTSSVESTPAEQDEPEVGAARNDAMLLFYELITRPTASLTLSYPALDSKGQPLPPSPLLTDLQRSVDPIRIPLDQLTMGQSAAADGQATSLGGFRRQAVAKALEGEASWLAGMISQPKFVRSGSSILVGIDCIAQRGKRDAFGAYEGLVNSPAAQAALAKRFDAEHLWSPSRLEGYAACPFRFFAEQLLGVEPLNELTLRNDARRRGSLLHQVLATIHEELSRDATQDSEVDASADELVTRFLAALDALVKSTPLRGIDQALREIERREIEAWVPSYAEQEINYRRQWQHLDGPPRPTHFEVRFGPETRGSDDDANEEADRASTPLPFELDLGEESIRLTGQIDRVDIGQVGSVTVFNIIDYKSGKEVRLKHDKVRSGHQLQLPLYALAAERLLLAVQDALALATGYWNIQGKGFQTKNGGSLQLRELADSQLKTSADWQQLEPEILGRVQEIVSGIRRGDFPVYNADEHCTRSCELSTVCRISQIRSLEKVWPVEPDPAESTKESTKESNDG